MASVEIIKAQPNTRRRTNLGEGGLRIDRQRVAAYARVSTNDKEQLGSFKSQIQYYTDKIKANKDWVFAGIYADEATTGTKVEKREEFQKMIQDCLDGKIDIVLTKSISRFARNTVDTLNYVRMLKEKRVAVIFEKENINTMTMNGELLLTILSSLAQQDVETCSGYVKMGLKMMMERGELVSFNGCLGYDYHPEDKSITVNEKEAEVVRMIYDLYLQGYGTYTIAKRLEAMGIKNKKGDVHWTQGGVMYIIRNEKNKGDICQGKSFTTDPISKRRIKNFGEEDMFYIKDHHEPIVSREVWDKANEIRLSKGIRYDSDHRVRRDLNIRKYTFSGMCQCAFCGAKLSRKVYHSNSKYLKPVWYCMNASKYGKRSCPTSKSVSEEMLEGAFLEAYQLLAENFDDVLDAVILTVEENVEDKKEKRRISQVSKDISETESRKSKLTDMFLDGQIPKDAYEKKYGELEDKLKRLVDEKTVLSENIGEQKIISKRLQELRENLTSGEILDSFDRTVFESIVDSVIVGETKEDGSVDPYKITFVLKENGSKSVNCMKERYRNFTKEVG